MREVRAEMVLSKVTVVINRPVALDQATASISMKGRHFNDLHAFHVKEHA